jgi:O-succinylbenzoic acid--CoA ligase
MSEVPMLTFLQNTIEKWRNETALISRQNQFSYAEFYRHVAAVSAGLYTHGFRSGDRAGLLAPNSQEYIILLFALWRIRVVTVLLNTRWPAATINKSLRDLSINSIFSDSGDSGLLINDISQFSVKEFVLSCISESDASLPEKIIYDSTQDATILFTSGSAGFPKAVLHSLGNHYYNARGSNRNIPIKAGDRWLLSLPLYHVGGLAILFRVFLAGGAVVLPDENLTLEKVLQNFDITHISLVPTQLMRLLRREENLTALRNMKAVLLGGAPIPGHLIQQAMANKITVFASYGSTEMSSQITTTAAGDSFAELNSAGRLLSCRELRIDEESEILVRGKTLFKGYLDKGRLNPARDDDGWFHSGDLGIMNEKGYLKILGRKDNMFISGGENIYPEEIEQELCQLKGVQDAVVVAVEHAEFGKRPVAFVKTADNSEYMLTNLKGRLRQILPAYKVPDKFFPWPEWNDTSRMKINRDNFKKIVMDRYKSGKL